MSIIHRYFRRQLVGFFIMLLLVLSGLAWMLQILTMLKFLIQYGINVWGFVGLTALMLPFIVSIILPFTIFIMVMFVYNRLISDREITVLAASGMSPMQLARPALTLAGFLTVAHFILNIWIVPASQVKFYDTQWDMRYGLAHLKLQESTFTQMTRGLVVFVERVRGHDLSGLMLYDNRDPKTQMIVSADKGKMVQTNRGLSMVMSNGSVQYKSDRLVIGTFDSFDMDMNVGDKGADTNFKVRRIPTRELIQTVMHPDDLSDKERAGVMSEMANRLLGPLMCLILALIGVAVLLKSSLLRRSGINFAAPVAVLGMVVAQTAFMTVADTITSMNGIYAIAAGQSVAILILFFALAGKKQKSIEHS
ncbi:MAG: LptF/LptG family permease [Proteobacteria bacterium]|nr:LptF/LptG family permease [Pseudomonadota bacterium]